MCTLCLFLILVVVGIICYIEFIWSDSKIRKVVFLLLYLSAVEGCVYLFYRDPFSELYTISAINLFGEQLKDLQYLSFLFRLWK